MLWLAGSWFMILLGSACVFIGLYLPMYEYAIMGGILVVAGIGLLVAVRRGPITRNL